MGGGLIPPTDAGRGQCVPGVWLESSPRASLSCSWPRVGSGLASVSAAQGWDMRHEDTRWFLGSQGPPTPQPSQVYFLSRERAHPLLTAEVAGIGGTSRWDDLSQVTGRVTGRDSTRPPARSRLPRRRRLRAACPPLSSRAVPEHALPGETHSGRGELLSPPHTQDYREG